MMILWSRQQTLDSAPGFALDFLCSGLDMWFWLSIGNAEQMLLKC